MAIDAYSPCPGGTGKKIKFCCSEMLTDLQKIDRMIEGEQFAACLQHIEQLEKTSPDRACLLATKTLLLRVTGKIEEFAETVTQFREKHPDNPLALTESAISALATESGKAALIYLEQAIAASGQEMSGRLYEAMGMVSQQLLRQGHYAAARALALFQSSINREDMKAVEFLVRINSAPSVPLLLKEDRLFEKCPDDAPYRDKFGEAGQAAGTGRWAESERLLTELSQEHPQSADILRNLATIRGWLADDVGCREALQAYAALDVSLEDAVEAEALAGFLSENPLDDAQKVCNLTYLVKDFEQLQAALISAPVAKAMPFDPASMSDENTPAPKHIFTMLDREIPDKDAKITWQTIPTMLCQALLFGKETDREARLEVRNVLESEREAIHELLTSLGGDALDSACEENDSAEVSSSATLLHSRWFMPEHVTEEESERVAGERLKQVLQETWSTTPLNYLDGKSPADAAKEESLKVRVLGAIIQMEIWVESIDPTFDFNELRSHLGLPTLDAIEVDGKSSISEVPLSRLNRVVVEKLEGDAVVLGYRRALTFGAAAASRKFALVLVEREDLAAHPDRTRAFQLLAASTEDPLEGLAYVARGRQADQEGRVSCVMWDLAELSHQFTRADTREITRLIQHYQQHHMQEQGAAEALARLLVEVGALGPDGSLSLPTATPEGAGSPSLEVPGEESPAEESKLWTPESQKPPEKKSGIWTPDMD